MPSGESKGKGSHKRKDHNNYYAILYHPKENTACVHVFSLFSHKGSHATM